MSARKKGLGKGLDALLGDSMRQPKEAGRTESVSESSPKVITDTAVIKESIKTNPATKEGTPQNTPAANTENRVLQIPVEQCQRGKYQPRREMDQEALEDLASSIKSQGVIQPIILRPINDAPVGVKYEIVAGERRWRASQLAGLMKVPAIIKDVDDNATVAMALIENLQRDDLNPMDEAYAIGRLQEEFELTHKEIAELLGKSRASVTNSLRLLGLQDDVKRMLERGDIEMGHARALLALPSEEQNKMALQVIQQSLTVRQTEALVKKCLKPEEQKTAQQEVTDDANIRHLQTELSEKIGVPVSVKHKRNGTGQVILNYNNLDELDGILSHIK